MDTVSRRAQPVDIIQSKIRFRIAKVLSEIQKLLILITTISGSKIDLRKWKPGFDRENFEFLDLWILRKVQGNDRVQKQYFTSFTSL